MRKMNYPAAVLFNKLFTEYPERITGPMHYIWARKIFKECNINKLRVGIGTNYYPYYFEDEYKRLQGHEIDLCEMMKQYFEVDIEYKQHYHGPMGLFVELVASLENNEVDLIVSSLGVNAERSRFVNFTVPYFENYLGLVVNEKYKNIRNLHELNKPDIKIAVSIGSTAEFPALKSFYRANIIKYAGSEALEKKILEERVDAVIGDAKWINFLQKRHPSEIHILEKRIAKTSELTSIAVAKDKPLLTAAMSIFLMQYNDSPVRAKNYQKWFCEAEAI